MYIPVKAFIISKTSPSSDFGKTVDLECGRLPGSTFPLPVTSSTADSNNSYTLFFVYDVSAEGATQKCSKFYTNAQL